MTVREALNAAEARLRKTGTPDARLDAEYMLAEALRAARIFGQTLAVFLRGQIQAKAS